MLQGGERRKLSVRRQVKQTVDGKIRNRLRSSALNWYTRQLCLVAVCDVVHPSIVGRTFRVPIVGSRCELLQIATRGVRAPNILVSRAYFKDQIKHNVASVRTRCRIAPDPSFFLSDELRLRAR